MQPAMEKEAAVMLQSMLDSYEAQSTQMSEALAQETRLRHSVEGDLATSKQRENMLRDQVQAIRDSYDRVVRQHDSDCHALRLHSDDVSQTIAALQGDCHALRVECDGYSQTIAALQGDCHTLRVECDEYSQTIAALEGDCHRLRGEKEVFRVQMKRTMSELEAAGREIRHQRQLSNRESEGQVACGLMERFMLERRSGVVTQGQPC